jgi:cytochrome P450
MDHWLAEKIDRPASPTATNLLARLLDAEVDGDKLTRQEIVGFVQLLLVGGQETTTNLIANAIHTFLQHPDQMSQLREQTGLLPAAIEEVLRYRSPFQWTPRVTLREAELHGHRLPAGQRVIAFIGSANHDSAQFKNPEIFDIRRHPNPHIAFGHGVHFCLGAPLARLEARIALTDLLNLKGLRLASDEPWEPRDALHVLGPAHLPILFERAAEI